MSTLQSGDFQTYLFNHLSTFSSHRIFHESPIYKTDKKGSFPGEAAEGPESYQLSLPTVPQASLTNTLSGLVSLTWKAFCLDQSFQQYLSKLSIMRKKNSRLMEKQIIFNEYKTQAFPGKMSHGTMHREQKPGPCFNEVPFSKDQPDGLFRLYRAPCICSYQTHL